MQLTSETLPMTGGWYTDLYDPSLEETDEFFSNLFSQEFQNGFDLSLHGREGSLELYSPFYSSSYPELLSIEFVEFKVAPVLINTAPSDKNEMVKKKKSYYSNGDDSIRWAQVRKVPVDEIATIFKYFLEGNSAWKECFELEFESNVFQKTDFSLAYFGLNTANVKARLKEVFNKKLEEHQQQNFENLGHCIQQSVAKEVRLINAAYYHLAGLYGL